MSESQEIQVQIQVQTQAIVDKWLAIAHSTAPTDEARAERGIQEVYSGLNKPTPQIIWVDSPLAGFLAALMLSGPESIELEVVNALAKDPEKYGARDMNHLVEIYHSAELAVRSREYGSRRTQHQFLSRVMFELQAYRKVSLKLGSYAEVLRVPNQEMGLKLREILYSLGGRVVRGIDPPFDLTFLTNHRTVIEIVAQAMLPGQFDVGMSAFNEIDAIGKGLHFEELVEVGLTKIAQSASVWWPLEGVAVMTRRPVLLQTDDGGRLHCEDGPALRYGDGAGFWYWHGVHVPQKLIEGTLTAEEVLKLPNVEVRRCAIERMGWDWFINGTGLRTVGLVVDDPGNPGHRLSLYAVPPGLYEENINVLVCDNGTVERDGTRRRFGLTVPASITHPLEAAAWTYGLTAEQYAQAQRRS